MSELRESACIYCHKAIRTTVERDFCHECYVIQMPIRAELATTRRERDDYKQAWQRDLAKGREFLAERDALAARLHTAQEALRRLSEGCFATTRAMSDVATEARRALAEPPGETTGPRELDMAVGLLLDGMALTYNPPEHRERWCARIEESGLLRVREPAPASRDSRGTACAKWCGGEFEPAPAEQAWTRAGLWYCAKECYTAGKPLHPTPPSTKGTCGLCTGSRYICDKGTAGCDATNCRHNRRPCPDCAPQSEEGK